MGWDLKRSIELKSEVQHELWEIKYPINQAYNYAWQCYKHDPGVINAVMVHSFGNHWDLFCDFPQETTRGFNPYRPFAESQEYDRLIAMYGKRPRRKFFNKRGTHKGS